MQLLSAASSKITHPYTLVPASPCMVYKFDTGNKYIIWRDGQEFFTRSNGDAMSRRCIRARQQMRDLAKAGVV